MCTFIGVYIHVRVVVYPGPCNKDRGTRREWDPYKWGLQPQESRLGRRLLSKFPRDPVLPVPLRRFSRVLDRVVDEDRSERRGVKRTHQGSVNIYHLVKVPEGHLTRTRIGVELP